MTAYGRLLGDPTVAGVWRRQTFSAAVESVTPELSLSILREQMPDLLVILGGWLPSTGGTSLLDSAYDFSRMLHGSAATSGDIFYRAFVPEVTSTLHARQIELVKRCIRSERSEPCRVGATLFPGLVKVSRHTTEPENIQVSEMALCSASRLTIHHRDRLSSEEHRSYAIVHYWADR